MDKTGQKCPLTKKPKPTFQLIGRFPIYNFFNLYRVLIFVLKTDCTYLLDLLVNHEANYTEHSGQ